MKGIDSKYANLLKQARNVSIDNKDLFFLNVAKLRDSIYNNECENMQEETIEEAFKYGIEIAIAYSLAGEKLIETNKI